jgi:H+-transporting ATPase
MWHSRPGAWLIFFTLMNIAITMGLAITGILMMPLPASLVIAVLAATVAFAFVLDFVKVAVFGLLHIE